MTSLHLRSAVRAIVLDEEDRILLCRFTLPERVVWAAPGGGVEAGETPHAALRRELKEEIGLTIDGTPPHVWHREIVKPGHIQGYDGQVEDYFLVRTAAFQPSGALSDEELAAENITAFRWWRLEDITDYQGPELFGPRDLAGPLARLLKDGVPDQPLALGL